MKIRAALFQAPIFKTTCLMRNTFLLIFFYYTSPQEKY